MEKKYLLHGIDDLFIGNDSKIKNVLDVQKSDILCFGTGLEDYCNYKCIYCYAGDIEKKKKEDILTLERYFELFQEAIDLGCTSVIITGALSMAEPLMSPKLLPVIKFLKEHDITIVLFTNASIFGDDETCKRIHGVCGEELCKIFYKAGVSMIISCDSLDAANYDKIVAVKGAYKKFKLSINRLKQIGYSNVKELKGGTIITRIAFSTVITKSNFKELEMLQEYCHKNNWQYICKFPSLMGNAITNIDNFFSPNEAAERRDIIEKYSDKPQTLAIVQKDKRYCLMNQLGIAMNNKGEFLTCLSGTVAFRKEDQSIKRMTLKEIVLLKKSMYGCEAGVCPKKVKYYGDMEV